MFLGNAKMTWDGQASAEAQTDHRHVNFSAQGGSRARVRPEEHRDDGLREVPPAIIDDVANHKPQSQTPSGFRPLRLPPTSPQTPGFLYFWLAI